MRSVFARNPDMNENEMLALPEKSREAISIIASKFNGNNYKYKCLSNINSYLAKTGRFYREYDKCMGIVSKEGTPEYANRLRTVCQFSDVEKQGFCCNLWVNERF